ncbi:MAG TPA: TIM barrel protein [Bacillota bacterium]|nr:TIM barrel protein [Bacillota bacterium]
MLSCSALNFVPEHLSDEELVEVTARAIPIIRAAGFTNMEVYLRKPSLGQLSRIRDLTVGEGLQIQSVHFHKPLLNKGNLEMLARLHRLLEASQYLGARLGVLHPPVREPLARRLDICRRVLESVLPRAESLGFMVTLENLGGPDSLELLSQIVWEYPSPCLGVTLDLKFLYASGHSLEEAFAYLGARIQNVHLNEYTGSLYDLKGKRKYPPLGSGQVDFSRLAALCTAYRFRGTWTLETLLDGDKQARLEEIRAWVVQLFD